MASLTIGIVGFGFVGQATHLFSRSPDVEAMVYDIDPNKCDPGDATPKMLADACDLIFICVPTPSRSASDGRCDTRICESVVNELKEASNTSENDPILILRSTVPPGTCERLGVAHMPEYLTERNWEDDFIHAVSWELGVNDSVDAETCFRRISRLLDSCASHYVIETQKLSVKHSTVTECAKYMRNCFLAARVSFCNEFARYCEAIGVEYNDVRSLVTMDPRIGVHHTQVPGPDGKTGFGGTCLPKDVAAIIKEMFLAGSTPHILSAIKTRNDYVDRPELDWLQDVGRAVAE